ncbi:hypothetical protein DMB38_21185 [Streptomyces sp. WAC 06738]|uniref:hypothetical protein n=1 Tax=Streptomyces sp. WAC 06738 TaxID=2203210 RepID=UPI000F6EDF09|nr:hypothetical protein [Streptomyces sp. WAC 06738]AZM47966.1 hypothetical protein DMB38_21185 [Streptomyces sp. WAC 06738]
MITLLEPETTTAAATMKGGPGAGNRRPATAKGGIGVGTRRTVRVPATAKGGGIGVGTRRSVRVPASAKGGIGIGGRG